MPDGNNLANMNMYLWENLRLVDRKFTKPITGKSYKGDSPNPTYIIRKLTEVLGPIGHRWGFEVEFDRVRLGKPHKVVSSQSMTYGPPDAQGNQPVMEKSATYEIIREEYHEVCIRFWIVSKDGDTRSFSAYGGTPMLYLTKSGTWMHDEDAAKKSLTDAYTKAASWLGACADIFLGLFDDKYSSVPENITTPPTEAQHGQDGMGAELPPPEGQVPSQRARRSTTANAGW